MKILLGAIYPYAFLLMYLVLPFDNYLRVLPNILLGILVVAFPFVVSKSDLKKLTTTPALFFSSFFLFLILNSLVFGRFETDFNIIKKVFVGLGLFVLYIPINDIVKLKKVIIFSSLATILFSIINIIIVNNKLESVIFNDYPMLIESLLIDRIYLGFLAVLSILISYNSFKPKFHPNNRYYLANIIINVLFLILIVSKIALLILLVLIILRQFYGKHKSRKVIATLVLITVSCVVYTVFTKDLKKEGFVKSVLITKTDFIKNSLTWDVRTVVWHCSNIVIKEKGLNLKGLGFAGTKDNLANCYTTEIDNEVKRNTFVSERYNTHNQFIDFYLSAGLFAIILFTAFLISLFIKNRKDFFLTALLVVVTSYFLMENVFHRQLGAYYAGFVFIILLTQYHPLRNNDIKA
ncbi:O-antigen ligase family protein [Ulvibacter litoralis]|uniref:O-antigen ligase n=1 Tax=Ulvibacter litoralis TaxID=227084 RepID=A0A1G7D832_9FLAO|nr:O-antigen ligase family protein [Ulvibacter litoralis]SDE47693.1 hypothetical protein SAMN05421855_101817 [Ulvibacter litoralis]